MNGAAMSILSTMMTLFLVMDPVGAIPVFAAVLKDVDAGRWSRVVLRENLFALATLLIFFFFGPTIMGWLHIEQPALNVAGGLVLIIVALEMIFPRRGGWTSPEHVVGEPLIVPLAIPLIAGPSTMATVMLMSTRAAGLWAEGLVALVAAWGAGLVILLLAGRLQRLIGPRGLVATERLMGMILVVVAVQMAMTGVEGFLEHSRS